MDIALLNCRITLQKNTVAVDDIGNHLLIWDDYFSCAATLGSESGTENSNAGQLLESYNCTFTVRYCSETASVTPGGFRILYLDELYDIIQVDHMNMKKNCLKLRCQKARR